MTVALSIKVPIPGSRITYPKKQPRVAPGSQQIGINCTHGDGDFGAFLTPFDVPGACPSSVHGESEW